MASQSHERTRSAGSTWIAIEGLVGAGKTTTAELIGASLGIPPVLEQVEQHPVIEAYYGDPPRFVLETELVFMSIHLSQIKGIVASGPIVSDFSPAKNLIYAECVVTGNDLALLERVDRRLWRDIPPPDLAVFLDVEPRACLDRVRLRGRPFEQGMTINDLRELRDGYRSKLRSLAREVVNLEIDSELSRDAVASYVRHQISHRVPDLKWKAPE